MNTMEMKQKLKTMYPKSENWARKVVDTWTLIPDPNAGPHKCDLFLKEVFENLQELVKRIDTDIFFETELGGIKLCEQ